MQPFSTPPSPPCRRARADRLEQIYRRDPAAEGRFWYSVVTTGVYCRPTCPSRRAHPANIRIHDSLAEARATGFRPCRRCMPEALSQGERHRTLIETICRLIDAGAAPASSKALAEAVGLSPSQLHRLFRRVKGSTPLTYANRSRPTGRPRESEATPVNPGTQDQARRTEVRIARPGPVRPGERCGDRCGDRDRAEHPRPGPA